MKQAAKWITAGVIGFALIIALTFGTKSTVAYAEDRYADFQIFAKVLNLVQQYYVEEVDTKKLVYGALKGMLRELDPHTNFLQPELFREFENETSGEFGGIGIEISIQNGILTIISPIEDTPAFEAGIQPGDKIIAVDNKSTKGLSLVEASQLMRGKKGSKIKLTVVRVGSDTPRDFVITRGSVKIKSVKYTDLEDGYAYFKITSFIENTGKDLERAIEDHLKKNRAIKGAIIDLRRNPGGLLDQAIKVSDLFLSDGIIVSTIGRDKKDKEVAMATKRETDHTDFPIIVLMNEYSASASEIVAGALQDNKRALVMGTRSFGKGSVQSVIKLGDGSGLKLTVARYYTPSGISIQAEGIKPDVELPEVDSDAFDKVVVKNKATREKDIAGHLQGDRERDEAESEAGNGKTKGGESTSGNALAWWSDAKESSDGSPKSKVLAKDFQALQAYNYLKAWGTIRNLGPKPTR
jgi:carboxyl-terminal processing protease